MKFLLLIVVLFLSSCDIEKEYFYINTLAIEIKEDKYIIKLLQYQNEESIISTVETKSIEEGLKIVNDSYSQVISLNYVSNLIIDSNSINKKMIEDILVFVSNRSDMTLNFYVYITDKVDELLEIRNFDEDTNINVFISPKRCDNLLYLEYLEFARNYLDKKVVYIPRLEISEVMGKKTIFSNKKVEFSF